MGLQPACAGRLLACLVACAVSAGRRKGARLISRWRSPVNWITYRTQSKPPTLASQPLQPLTLSLRSLAILLRSLFRKLPLLRLICRRSDQPCHAPTGPTREPERITHRRTRLATTLGRRTVPAVPGRPLSYCPSSVGGSVTSGVSMVPTDERTRVQGIVLNACCGREFGVSL